MEFHANEDVIELARSINRAMDSRTKPLDTIIERQKAKLEVSYKQMGGLRNEIEQLQAELETFKEVAVEDARTINSWAERYHNLNTELAAKDKRIEIYKTALENVVNPGVDIYMADCINIARQALTKGEGG